MASLYIRHNFWKISCGIYVRFLEEEINFYSAQLGLDSGGWMGMGVGVSVVYGLSSEYRTINLLKPIRQSLPTILGPPSQLIFLMSQHTESCGHFGSSPSAQHWVISLLVELRPWFNIKMTSYQNRRSHCGDKMVARLSYLHNGISYNGKMSSLYWTSPLVAWSPNLFDLLSPGRFGGNFEQYDFKPLYKDF